MVDFLKISTRSLKRGVIEILPKFIVGKSSDLMIRGGDFYAVWLQDQGRWSTDEDDVIHLVDCELDKYVKEHSQDFGTNSIYIRYMWDSESGMIDRWHKYCQSQMRDSFHMLDEKLIFSNTPTKKRDYASKALEYPLEAGDYSAWDTLVSTLYSEEERRKIEWAIGSIVSGDSKKIQKFMVLYGAAGTGKSTILNVIEQLFNGYYAVFDAKALGSANGTFALEPFKTNPLVAIQHDGDLSKIEDNTRLNSLVAHELMTVNEKFKSTYSSRFKCFLFMGTNKPVRITDAKSGLIRRLIDVSPTGEKIEQKEYRKLVKQIEFELGAIASHCLDVYKDDPGYYDNYIPLKMLGASNDFFNFVIDSYHVFKKEDGTSLKAAWEMYRTYCDEAKVAYPFSQRIFKEELKNYFRDYKDRFSLENGSRVRSYYSGFRSERFEEHTPAKKAIDSNIYIQFKEGIPSVLDKEYADCPAQYATSKEMPRKPWDQVETTLSDLDTSELHYVRPPKNHIVIDFDLKDENGKKSFTKNLEAASKWPPTYAEISKSGQGIHLHYIYTGDTSRLCSVYDDDIEIKVFSGKSSLRRKLIKCNDLRIAELSSGLPMKGEDKLVNFDAIQSEKGLRTLIRKNLGKEIHPATKPSVDFIFKILEDAYESGIAYDVTDMRPAILAFAANSSHQSEYCIKQVNKMKFKSMDSSELKDERHGSLVFYDVEIFPNLFLVNWKAEGENKPPVRMINPSPSDIEELMQFKLVGFNCRRYDNHLLYARLMGYTNEQLYTLSTRIIGGSKNCFFSEAYNVSYTDVYDFCSKKQSLKKWEIELGIHHEELGLPWDKPVPEELWPKVAEYCDNDVIATEAVFNARQSDFTARKVLADVAGMTVNDTTNSLTTKIIFGKNRNPQTSFNYRNLGDTTGATRSVVTADNVLFNEFGDEYTMFDEQGRPVFPGYIYDHGKSIYRGEEVGEGGYVYSEPGMYGNVALLDIASMHPSSIVAEELFGPEYTKRFKELLDARIAIKHGDFDKARKMLGGALAKYLTDSDSASDLAYALKIAINSVYGLTSAPFENPFNDIRNKDNIVAKRGALFMVNLKHEVQRRGFIVAHIKTDSIKIPDATPEIIQFVTDYGKQYGYTFEHEATYDRICLVNKAVYVAKYKDGKHSGEWTATGTQFQVPYVFKKLFSHEPVIFDDLCETKSVMTALYLSDCDPKIIEEYENVQKLRSTESGWRMHGLELAWKGTGDKKAYKELTKINKLLSKYSDVSDEELERMIQEAYGNVRFVGRVGRFCPIKPGCGGKMLLRDGKDKNGRTKYYAVADTKGYLWLEAEAVKLLGKEDDIDRSYYDNQVNAAIKDISSYGDYEWFVSDDPYISPEYRNGVPVYDNLPF